MARSTWMMSDSGTVTVGVSIRQTPLGLQSWASVVGAGDCNIHPHRHLPQLAQDVGLVGTIWDKTLQKRSVFRRRLAGVRHVVRLVLGRLEILERRGGKR